MNNVNKTSDMKKTGDRKAKRAIVFSGGGGRGGYEIGVWKALRQLGLKIDIATGTSVGAINAAMLCTGEYDKAASIWRQLETNMVFDLDNLSRYDDDKENIIRETRELNGMPLNEAFSYAKKAITKGGAGSTGLLGILKNDLAPEKLYSSDIQFGMVTCELPSFKGRFLFKDDIPPDKLCEYLVASASCFPAVHYMSVDGKKLVDGGYADNLPVDMAMELGATEIIAVDMEAVGVIKKDSIKRAKESLDSFICITSNWDLGNFLCFDPETNRRNMILGYHDGLKALGMADGGWYTFTKGSIPENRILMADTAAQIFELDPLVMYDRNTLNATLKEKTETVKRQFLAENPYKMIRLTPDKLQNALSKYPAEKIEKALRSYFSPAELTIIIAGEMNKTEDKNASLNQKLSSLLQKEITAAGYLRDLIS